MRLTALAGSNVYLELFIIADEQAANEKMILEFSDKYRFEKGAERDVFRQHLAGFAGETYQQDIGHPFAQKLIWDGCVVTRLCGTIQPRQMSNDIVLKLSAVKPYQKYCFSRLGAMSIAYLVGIGTCCVLLIVLTCIYYRKVKEENRGKFYLTRIILPTALYSLLFLGVTYAAIPKVNVETGGTRFGHILRGHMVVSMAAEIAEKNDYFRHKDVNEVAMIVDDYFKTGHTPVKEIKQEDSPGNYTIFKNDKGEIVLRFYSRGAYPYDIILTSKPEKPYAGN
jgi:hypothetical protein